MVECLVANENVGGSNPLTCSIIMNIPIYAVVIVSILAVLGYLMIGFIFATEAEAKINGRIPEDAFYWIVFVWWIMAPVFWSSIWWRKRREEKLKVDADSTGA